MKFNLAKEDLVRMICACNVPEKYIPCCRKKGLVKDVGDARSGGPEYKWCGVKLMKRDIKTLATIYENIVERKITIDEPVDTQAPEQNDKPNVDSEYFNAVDVLKRNNFAVAVKYIDDKFVPRLDKIVRDYRGRVIEIIEGVDSHSIPSADTYVEAVLNAFNYYQENWE